MRKSFFITLEGVEGVGKSTNLDFISGYIRDAGHEVLTTREPGGTAIAEKIRSLLLDHDDETLTADAELLLMFAARAQHLEHVIKPALANGKWVVCDRFTDATFAYQGGGRNFSMDKIAWLESMVQKGLTPDLTVLLDLPVAIGLERAANRSVPDRFEVEKKVFFENVRAMYLKRAEAEQNRFCVIDAMQALPDVQGQISKHLAGLL